MNAKYTSLLLLFIFVLFLTKPLFAAENADDTLVIGVAEEDVLITDRILYTAFTELGEDIVIKHLPQKSALLELEAGTIDVIAAQPDSFIEADGIVKIPVSLFNAEVRAYTAAANGGNPKSFADLSKYERLIYTEGSLNLKPSLPSSSALTEAQTTEDLFSALLSGEADIAIATVPELLTVIVPEGVKESVIDTVPLYTYMSEEKSSLLPEAERIFAAIRQDGRLTKLKAQEPLEKSASKVVLHISSYDNGMRWDSNLVRGIQDKILEEANISYYNFSLDIGRVDSIENQKAALREMISSAFLQKAPDVIIVSDNAALDFVRENYFELFPNVPLIYCGINGYEDSMLYGLADYSVGVAEEISAADTIEEMLSLYPETKRIFVVNDYSEMGNLWKQAIVEQISSFTDRVSIEYNDKVSFSSLIDTVSAFGDDTIVLCGDYFRDGDGVFIEEKTLGAELSRAADRPVFALMDADVGVGMLGGKVIDRYELGKKVGAVAQKILDGAKTDDVSLRRQLESENRWFIDYEIVEKANINPVVLPDHVAVNKKEAFYEESPTETIIFILISTAAVIIMGLLAFFVTKLRKSNKELLFITDKMYSDEDMNKKEIELSEVKGRLENIIDAAPFAYSLSVDGNVLEANNYLKEVLDYNEGDAFLSYYVNPAERNDAIERLNKYSKIIGDVVKLRLRNGRISRFIVSAANVQYNGQLAKAVWAVEVEKIESQKDKSKSAETSLGKILDTLPIPMMMIESFHKEIVYENDAFKELFQTQEAPEKKKAGDINMPFVYDLYMKEKPKMPPDETSVTFEYGYNRKGNNELVDLRISAREIKYKGKDTVLFICQNISDQRKQEELLQEAADKEREANQLKSIFLANMSHEIRTPMNAVLGLSQVALMKPQSKDNNDLFKKIHSSASNLLAIINDILDFSKIEAEKMDFVEEEFRLEEVIANSFMVAMERLEGKNVEMLLRISPDVPCYLYGDKTRLWQILKNLLDNSAKYTEEGRVVLKVKVNTKKSDSERASIVFEVSDTGIGMTKEQRTRLFNPFEQLNNEFKNKKTGTGLGMSITKQLIDLQNGTIKVDSEPGMGSTVTVEISFKRSESAVDVRQTVGAMLNASMKQLDPVLIVDDDVYSLMSMSELFSVSPIEAVCVKTGEEAIEKIREHNRNGRPFKLVIIDYLLGKDNGMSVGRKVRSLVPGVKMIMVTAYSTRLFSDNEAKEAGFLDVIEKPFIASSFIKRVCETVDGKVEYTQTVYPDYSNSRVLLCEDNLINQQVAISMLEVFGIAPKIANNGKEALEWLDREPFDLVFMDIIMPVMDGHEATQAIRKSNKPYRDIVIIAMTANVMSDQVELFVANGMDGYIEKPIDFNNLQENLQRFLGSRKLKLALAPNEIKKDEIIKIEGIETSQGLLRFGGKMDRYERALKHFAQKMNESLLPFEAYTADDTKKESAAILHTLKGVAGNLGIVGLHKNIVEFEKTLRKNEPDYVLYSKVNDLLMEISARILSALPDKKESTEGLPQGSREEFILGLKMLEEALELYDISKCEEALNKLNEKSWDAAASAWIKAVEKKTLEYEFDDAMDMIKERRKAGI